MFSPNRSGNRISATRNNKTNRVSHVLQKQSGQQKHQKQSYRGPDNKLGEESIDVRLPLLLNKPKNSAIQSSSTATATNRLPPPPPPPRSATTSLSLFPVPCQRFTQREIPSDRRTSSELLQIRLEAS
ncbi:unnamed protein product [Onchocerca ochengi]|uniref:Uncharacterized protein n=1 Tax=Onchocerca ochengi TaxID=42157 RepID=A0A182E2L7_ONCOC|nr:unnamed protein product [Onchocerca ochengi]